MLFVKKMCVLRQIKAGFTGDGRQAGGVVKAEQYGKNLAAEVSVVGFAPLAAGEYYCLLSDANMRTELLPLRGKSLFNIVSDLDISEGFCAVICLVKNGIVPLAYGVSGNKQYDFDELLRRTAREKGETSPYIAATAENRAAEEKAAATAEETDVASENEREKEELSATYDDETIAERDYYQSEEKEESEFEKTAERDEDEGFATTYERTNETTRIETKQNDYAENLRRKADGDSPRRENAYYRSVKDEIDEIFGKYEKDETLQGAFPYSAWVRVKESDEAEYLIGVIYENAEPLYICYALPAERKDVPPAEIAEFCAFVPLTPFENAAGCFVLFQSPETGECMKLSEA